MINDLEICSSQVHRKTVKLYVEGKIRTCLFEADFNGRFEFWEGNMHAIIRQGNGKYYVSYVFGYYTDIRSEDEYQRYVESIYNTYYVVWNEEKTKLIKYLEMEPKTKNRSIKLQVIVIDTNQDNWNLNEKHEGCVDFLSKELILSLLKTEKQPEDILEKCRAADRGYVYHEYQDIKTNADVANFDWAAGGLHDARISKIILQEDGTLYLRFAGEWSRDVEVWLWGDLKYDASSRTSEDCDPYWFGSTTILQDVMIYFADDDDLSVEEIKEYEGCYFIARNMRYRIIPE